MRLKLKKDIEAPFKAESEAKDKELSRIHDKSNSYKRQLELLRTEYEQFRIDKEKELTSLKERSSKEISDLMIENSSL